MSCPNVNSNQLNTSLLRMRAMAQPHPLREMNCWPWSMLGLKPTVIGLRVTAKLPSAFPSSSSSVTLTAHRP